MSLKPHWDYLALPVAYRWFSKALVFPCVKNIFGNILQLRILLLWKKNHMLHSIKQTNTDMTYAKQYLVLDKLLGQKYSEMISYGWMPSRHSSMYFVIMYKFKTDCEVTSSTLTLSSDSSTLWSIALFSVSLVQIMIVSMNLWLYFDTYCNYKLNYKMNCQKLSF